jgi:hypothetical protein
LDGFTQDGEYTANQKTPDLSRVIEELVVQTSWASGKRIVFIISRAPSDTTNNTRAAYSGKNSANNLPVLTIVYSSTGELVCLFGFSITLPQKKKKIFFFSFR